MEKKKIHLNELRKRKDQQKLERQIIKQRKLEEKVQQQKERELKKKEKMDCRRGKLSKEKFNKGLTNIGERSSLAISLEPNENREGQRSTPTTPLPKQHQILRDMYNILSPSYAALHNMHASCSQSPPHSPIKQFQIGRLLDENMFGKMTPISPQVDLVSPENATIDSTEDEPEPFLGFMVN